MLFLSVRNPRFVGGTPPPVKAVEIDKKNRGKRMLGVPTVADRVAQMVPKYILSRRWNHISIRIPMDTGQENRG